MPTPSIVAVFASDVVAFASETVAFAFEAVAFASEAVAFASEAVAFASEVTVFASDVVAFASEVSLGFSPGTQEQQRMGLVAQCFSFGSPLRYAFLSRSAPCRRVENAFAPVFGWERRASALRKTPQTTGALAPGLLFRSRNQTFSSPSSPMRLSSPSKITAVASRHPKASALRLSSPPKIDAVASRYPKASALGLSGQPRIGALAPGVCLPLSNLIRHSRKLLLPLALAATLITSCAPPKPLPKTTTFHT